ncbi:MAG: chorismate-binding protein [Bacteriovorax sp.]|nr:chorismate-binding protein [Bacteriovorax sp.]
MTDNSLFSIIPYKGRLIKLDSPRRAIAYYRHHAVDLLTGTSYPHDFTQWINENKKILLNAIEEKPRVIHLFYELSFLIENDFQFLKDDNLLVLDLEFSSFQNISVGAYKKINLKEKKYPNLKDYKKAFEIGYQELLKGNCYQFNLTYPYLYSFDNHLSPFDFIFSLWRDLDSRGAYGSATYIPLFKKLYLSNSPECLFQYKNNILSTMPIKGTLKRSDNDDLKDLWRKLVNDKKSQAELFMISDLLRNDLSRIELPRAKIVKRKFPKLVPGLIHQCSQIDVELGPTVSLWNVIDKIFPGGSITGAPKKRAINLIHSLEQRERGFYCGSTLILYQKMNSASINIRSSVVDFSDSTLLYQAGGGITLKSEVKEEFLEMTYKRDSFIRTLTL